MEYDINSEPAHAPFDITMQWSDINLKTREPAYVHLSLTKCLLSLVQETFKRVQRNGREWEQWVIQLQVTGNVQKDSCLITSQFSHNCCTLFSFSSAKVRQRNSRLEFLYDVVFARVAQSWTTFSKVIAYIWTDKQGGCHEHLLEDKPKDRLMGETLGWSKLIFHHQHMECNLSERLEQAIYQLIQCIV